MTFGHGLIRGSPFLYMELKEFVKTAIRDIANAVSELNEEMSSTGLLVNPIPNNHQNDMVYSSDGRCLQKIEFNVSVTTSETTEGGGNLKLYVAKADLNKKVSDESVNSLKFHITVALPAIND